MFLMPPFIVGFYILHCFIQEYIKRYVVNHVFFSEHELDQIIRLLNNLCLHTIVMFRNCFIKYKFSLILLSYIYETLKSRILQINWSNENWKFFKNGLKLKRKIINVYHVGDNNYKIQMRGISHDGSSKEFCMRRRKDWRIKLMEFLSFYTKRMLLVPSWRSIPQ